MNELLSGLWTNLTAAGGGVALGLIIAIALGINALTLLFMGSAVVALERFARAARRVRSVSLFGLLWACVLGAGAVYLRSGELGSAYESKTFVVWAGASAFSAVIVAVAVGITHTLLRALSPARLGLSVLIALGVGSALILGASGRVLFAAAPVAVALVLAAFLWLR